MSESTRGRLGALSAPTAPEAEQPPVEEIVVSAESEQPATEHEAGEENLEAECTELQHEAGRIKRERELTYVICHLQSEGVQTLIDTFGSETVLAEIKRQFLADKNARLELSTFDIIKGLVPDKKKREKLYDEMVTDANAIGDRFEQWEEDRAGTTQRDMNEQEEGQQYFRSMWGGKENFVRLVEARTGTMATLDTVLGKITPDKYRMLIGSRMADFANDISQVGAKEDELKQQLDDAEDNLLLLVGNRSLSTEQKTAELRARAEALRQKASQEVERITRELDTEFEEWRAHVVADLANLGTMDTASEVMKQAVEAALEKVRAEVEQRTQMVRQQITEQTKPLREIMQRTAGLERV